MSVRSMAIVCVGALWVTYANFANDSRKAPAEPQKTANARSANSRSDLTGGLPAEADHPLRRALKHAYSAQEILKEVKDYEARFSKRVNIRGKFVAESMHLKVREKPFSVYLRYANPHQGREVLFIDGMNGNNLLAHETGLKGLVGTVSLSPKSKTAMEGNVYPITEIGMTKLLRQVTAHWEKLLKKGTTRVQFYQDAKLGETPCVAIEVVSTTAVPDVRYHMWRIYFDRGETIPVHIELYGFPRRAGEQPPLMEEYTYSQVRLNVGLTDVDFSTENPGYGF